MRLTSRLEADDRALPEGRPVRRAQDDLEALELRRVVHGSEVRSEEFVASEARHEPGGDPVLRCGVADDGLAEGALAVDGVRA